ncbi:sigma-54 interaction domain-containing protein [Virgibacillus sp. DJP39]|uniref:sigma-54 interaction domain-containing protein n=1 Tax=Virgibacillus sp. DJP39 TaxID=3409790 RepID=UPI003BB724BF
MQDEYNFLQMELEGVLNASNDNIVITDGTGRVLKVSANCASIYGKDKSYLVGKTVYRLEEEEIFSPSVTGIVIKEKKEIQVMQKTTNGKVVMATGIPLLDQENRIQRVISFSHDLTEIQNLKEDYNELQKKMSQYKSEIEELKEKDTGIGTIVIKDEKMRKISETVQRVAASDATVVLLGESGVGKTLFARMLHNNSDRKEGAFREINCSAIPSSLFESEMFGYEAGSFTGANNKGKKGIIELAHKGTLFLDEIAELPIDIQVKLLKVLQDKTLTRVGGTEQIEVDFRLVVATNKDLKEMMIKGKFREDLFYRLSVIPVTIPPLRERIDDIYMFIHHYSMKFNKKYKTEKTFHTSTIDSLLQYEWPGNVRELENLIERLILTSDTNVIHPEILPFINNDEKLIYDQINWSMETFENQGQTLQDALHDVEKRWLKRAYRQFKTTYEMGKYLGLSQATVVRRLKKYNINSK